MQHDRGDEVVPVREDVGLGHDDVADHPLRGKSAAVDFRRRGFDDDAASAVRLRSNHSGVRVRSTCRSGEFARYASECRRFLGR